ncbi:MAG TPA: hypothetical protein VN903_32675 [Polyangia bacterium]|nr:hypothetical protein [Polyangia bacterium]
MALLRLALLLLLGAAAVASCYSPKQPACAFSCADDGLCPSGYSCGTDGVCHRDDGQGTCNIAPQVDAGLDAGGDGGD